MAGDRVGHPLDLVDLVDLVVHLGGDLVVGTKGGLHLVGRPRLVVPVVGTKAGTKDQAAGTKDLAAGTKDLAAGTKDLAAGTKAEVVGIKAGVAGTKEAAVAGIKVEVAVVVGIKVAEVVLAVVVGIRAVGKAVVVGIKVGRGLEEEVVVVGAKGLTVVGKVVVAVVVVAGIKAQVVVVAGAQAGAPHTAHEGLQHPVALPRLVAGHKAEAGAVRGRHKVEAGHKEAAVVPEAAGTTLPPPRLQVRARVQVQARPMALRPTRPVVVAVLLAVPAGLVDAMGLRLGGVAAAVGAVGRAPRALPRHRSRPRGLVAHRPATVVAAAMAQAATTARKAGGRLVAIVRISNRGVASEEPCICSLRRPIACCTLHPLLARHLRQRQHLHHCLPSLTCELLHLLAPLRASRTAQQGIHQP